MSDLIKRIDGWQYDVPADMKLHALLMDCKASLEAKGEPVAWYAQDNLEVKYDTEVIWGRSKPVYAEVWIPLYTAPPSVDALIAEIDILGIVEKDGSDWLNFYKVQAILDKYRSKP